MGCGTVFQLTSSGSGWTENVLHRFDFDDGAYPSGNLRLDRAGSIYGTTGDGGIYTCPDSDQYRVRQLMPGVGNGVVYQDDSCFPCGHGWRDQ